MAYSKDVGLGAAWNLSVLKAGLSELSHLQNIFKTNSTFQGHPTENLQSRLQTVSNNSRHPTSAQDTVRENSTW